MVDLAFVPLAPRRVRAGQSFGDVAAPTAAHDAPRPSVARDAGAPQAPPVFEPTPCEAADDEEEPKTLESSQKETEAAAEPSQDAAERLQPCVVASQRPADNVSAPACAKVDAGVDVNGVHRPPPPGCEARGGQATAPAEGDPALPTGLERACPDATMQSPASADGDANAGSAQSDVRLFTLQTQMRLAEIIRREAVRLAAIACGRALRRVMLIHPRALAAFVDEAIAAAGHPPDLSVHVAPAVKLDLESLGRVCHEDVDATDEEVTVQAQGGAVRGDASTCARLLVCAASQAVDGPVGGRTAV